ncbi:MAG: glycosyltransferase family 4 protein [Acidimicrobiales bacterium]
MKHLLLTNDFPPKIGGIQSYLWELWRRLPAAETHVYTTPYQGAAAFDAEQDFWIRRSREPVLLPHPGLIRRINALVEALDIDLVIIDPAFPLGLLAGRLNRPYAVVLHGAEVAIPGRLAPTKVVLGRVLRGARLVIAAGQYPATEAERCAGVPLPIVVVPPGVDTDRFGPLDPNRRGEVRKRYGLDEDDVVVASVSRLVPRKGMDVLIAAAAELRFRHPGVRMLIGGKGRDENRLRRAILATGAPVELVGFIPDDELSDFYGAADVFAMLCRSRWMGLEQEGFGIVFAEAAACGVPALCGRSGGAHEAVQDQVTGLVVDRPSSVREVTGALDRLLSEDDARAAMAAAALQRANREFRYDLLAERLHRALHQALPPSGQGAVPPVPRQEGHL